MDQKKPVDVLVVGSINMDLVVTLDQAPEAGETRIGQEFHTYRGGKGANQAVAAARLGSQTAMFGKVGSDPYGSELLAALAAEGIDVSGIHRTGETPTGTAHIMVEKDGENRIIVVPGANAELLPTDLDEVHFARAKVLLVSQEIPAETVEMALRLGKAHGCITVLNPAPARPLTPEVLALVDVLVPNRTEARVLTGCTVESLSDAQTAADRLVQQGVHTVVITMGSRGALAVQGNLSELVPAYPVTSVDTTAAGDAFCGGLAAALARDASLLEAVTDGTAAASIAVTRRGAQPSIPRVQEVKEFLRIRR